MKLPEPLQEVQIVLTLQRQSSIGNNREEGPDVGPKTRHVMVFLHGCTGQTAEFFTVIQDKV